MKVLVRAAMLFAFFATLLGGCAAGGDAPKDIRVGVISMLSGDVVRPVSADLGRAVRLAADEVNARGGVALGRTKRMVTVFEEDDHNSPDTAVEAARRLILERKVSAIIGPQFSSNAIPAARLAEMVQVLTICPMSTNPDTTAGKRFVFRVAYLDTFQGSVLSRFARETLAARRAAVLYDVASPYNRTLAEVFSEAFAASGGAIVDSETYTSDAAEDFSPQLRRILAS